MEEVTLKTEKQWLGFFRNCLYLTEYFKEPKKKGLTAQERRILVEFAKAILLNEENLGK